MLVGREVVFQCRDEGPLRAQVRWIRGSGLALPPQSIDQNGRLEMPNIQVQSFIEFDKNETLLRSLRINCFFYIA